jgi:hypothetical protein
MKQNPFTLKRLHDITNNNKTKDMQWPENVSCSCKNHFFCSFAHVFFIRAVLEAFLRVCKDPDVIPVTFLLF